MDNNQNNNKNLPSARSLTSPGMMRLLKQYTLTEQSSLLDVNSGQVSLVPHVHISGDSYTVDFRIGTDRLYVVKNVQDFTDYMDNCEMASYGKGLSFYHHPGAFDEASRPLVRFLMDSVHHYDAAKNDWKHFRGPYLTASQYRFWPITFQELMEIFALYEGKILDMDIDGMAPTRYEFRPGKLKYSLFLTGRNGGISLRLAEPDGFRSETTCYYPVEKLPEESTEVAVAGNVDDSSVTTDPDLGYVLYSPLSEEQDIRDFLDYIRSLPKQTCLLGERELPVFCRNLLPALAPFCEINKESFAPERFLPRDVTFHIFLDSPQKDMIICYLEARYFDQTFYPFRDYAERNSSGQASQANELDSLMQNGLRDSFRDLAKENQVCATLMPMFTSFDKNSGMMCLQGDEDTIYDFLLDKLPTINGLGELYISDVLKNMMKPHHFRANVGVSLNGNLLDLSTDTSGITTDELSEIFSAYDKKKRYYRFKDSSYIDLSKDTTLKELHDTAEVLDLSAADLTNGTTLPAYRALYLDQTLLNDENISVSKDKSYRSMIRSMKTIDVSDYEVPARLDGILREYQKTGYRFIRTLYHNGFGGILADDMGLGKTLQVITFLVSEMIPEENEAVSDPEVLALEAKGDDASEVLAIDSKDDDGSDVLAIEAKDDDGSDVLAIEAKDDNGSDVLAIDSKDDDGSDVLAIEAKDDDSQKVRAIEQNAIIADCSGLTSWSVSGNTSELTESDIPDETADSHAVPAVSDSGQLPAVSVPGQLSAVSAPGQLSAVSAPGQLSAVSAPGQLSVLKDLNTLPAAADSEDLPALTEEDTEIILSDYEVMDDDDDDIIDVDAIDLTDEEKKCMNSNASDGTNHRTLIVCPSSLVYNWNQEIEKFAPELHHTMLTGNALSRRRQIRTSKEDEILITSYDQLKRDLDAYKNLTFFCQILDEAQYIKNQNTQAAKAVKSIRSGFRLALTGTPIENRLSELWSIFDFLMPGFLYKYPRFKTEIESKIVEETERRRENQDSRDSQVSHDSQANHDTQGTADRSASEKLQKMIRPFVLRRLKTDVLKDLPEKLEEAVYTDMTAGQRRLYEAHAERLKRKLANESDEALRGSRIQILSELTRLRQLCCDPKLVYENYTSGSGKLDTCMELIHQAIEGGHRILLFSQFTSIFPIIENRLHEDNIDYLELTGKNSKKERNDMVQDFQTGNIPVFLISLKAGGTGLNLTAADVVIHFDPWWNLSAQNQATDRVYRIGQENPVSVFKLIAKNSIEERIMRLQNAKGMLSESILSGEGFDTGKFDVDELMELLS